MRLPLSAIFRRPALTARLQFDAGTVSPAAARDLAAAAVDRVNLLYDAAHEAALSASGED